jgi:protein TonB
MSAISSAAGEGTRESARWVVSFLVVCALHLTAAALLSRTSIFVPPSPDIPPGTVLIDLDPVAAPAAPQAPPQPPPPERELRQEEPPPPVKAEVTLPKPLPRKPAPQRQEKIAAPAPQPAPAHVAAEPQPDATPMPKAQAAHTPSMDPMETWEHKLLARMQGFLKYPPRALLRRQDGVAYVRVVVDRQGNLVSAELQRSSGIPLLDDEAVAVVARAKPYPPPPPEVAGDKIARVVPVRFILR